MRQHFTFQITSLCVLGYIHVVKPEVHDYCLSPLNKSDCGLKMTPVITYWKPGSRCEINFWRGCPTQNKFANQYECHNLCIFRSRNTLIEESEEAIPSLIPEECTGKLNQDTCTDTIAIVYTYEDGVCVQKEWTGCNTTNSFKTEEECEVRCNFDQSAIDFENLDVKKLLQIEDMLDELEDKFDGKITIEIEKEEEISGKSAESAKNSESDDLSSTESESSEIVKLKGKVESLTELEEEQETTTLEEEKDQTMSSEKGDVEMTTSKEALQETTTIEGEEVKTITTRENKKESTQAKEKAIKTTTPRVVKRETTAAKKEEIKTPKLKEDNGDTTTADEESSTEEEEDESGDHNMTNEMPFIVTPRG